MTKMESILGSRKIYPSSDDYSDQVSELFREPSEKIKLYSISEGNKQKGGVMEKSGSDISSDTLDGRYILENAPTSHKGFTSVKSVASNQSSNYMNHVYDANTVTCVESLINFLTVNGDNICTDLAVMRDLESLTISTLNGSNESEIYRIIRANGWTGSRYKLSSIMALDTTTYLQSLSNWYLKTKLKNENAHLLIDVFEKGFLFYIIHINLFSRF